MKTFLFTAALMLSGSAIAQETVAPGNSAPELDARGIPVVSDPASAPPGVNEPLTVQPGAQVVPNPNASAAFATQPSTETYPVCSKTVTDNCVQAYERGVRDPT
ncbi:hypothetical protein [Sphingosinicella rhizophila]|uniref:Uncharacterized protein n=1 Tax=Sphingosinicella rhizophila TaxID=3050082 RepID=A0ABU3Q4T8_9SPHN|nr:hypothetical protein [Sphingosinicella sp. GR2756]MDT9598425.1 hypothetical protein [Sphingosinicella sp. GR2756]